MAYTVSLLIHSYLRWVVVALGLVVLVRSLSGWRTNRAWEPADNRAQVSFVSALDIQMLVGLVMYFALSPVTAAFLAGPKAAMKDPQLRFFGVEHQFAMLLGVIVVHAFRSIGKKKVDRARHRFTAIGVLVWVVLVIAAMPWPGTSHGRPLFRGL